MHRLQVTSHQQAESVGTEFRLTEPIHEMHRSPNARSEPRPSGCPRPASLDHYRLRDDAWAVLFTSQNVTISVMQAAAEAGVAAIGYDSLAGQRLTIPALLDRWHQQSAPAAPRERPASRLPC